jgi:hypothetical protein
MNEMALLSEMRADVAERDPDELSGARTRLRAAMSAPATPPPRARAHPGVRLAVASVVAVALAGGMAVGLGGQRLFGDGAGGRPAGHVATPADSPALRLAAALTATAGTTFRFHISGTIGMSDLAGHRRVARLTTMSGAYDPTGASGYLQFVNGDGSISEERLVNGHLYYLRTTKDGHVITATDGGTGTNRFLVFGPTGIGTPVADPGQLLEQLRQEGQVIDLGRSGRGAGAVHRYRLVNKLGRVEVEVGVAAKMVSRITLYGADGGALVEEYSDYGVPVTVQVPPLTRRPRGR